MTHPREFLSRLQALFRRAHLDRELDEELRFHLEMEIQENMHRGLSKAAARREAMMRLGGLDQIKESYRDQRGLPIMETVLRDVRLSIRSLTRRPVFSLSIILMAALGVGANVAIFSVVNSVLLEPLPFPQPDHLFLLGSHRAEGDLMSFTGQAAAFIEQNVQDIQVASYSVSSGMNLVLAHSATYVRSLPVSPGFFRVMGVLPLLGRPFPESSRGAGATDGVILSYSLWKRFMDADAGVIGETVRLGDRPFTVLGVMPPGFTSIPPVDVWTRLDPSTSTQGRGLNIGMVGRTPPDMTLEQARSRFSSLSQALAKRFSGPPDNDPVRPFHLQAQLTRNTRPALWILTAAVGLVLLIACANISGLLLARGVTRSREIATRIALGGGRGRIIRQLLTESLLLSVGGGVLGVFVAYGTLRWLESMIPAPLLLWKQLHLDWRVLSFALLVSLLTGLLFGLWPALQSSRLDLIESLREDGGRAAAGNSSNRFRGVLVVAQVAICVLLLTGTGLLLRTFLNLRTVKLGFDPHNVMTAQMSLQGSQYSSAPAIRTFFRRGLAAIRRLPGVESAAVCNNLPVEGVLNLPFHHPFADPTQVASLDWRYVSPGYFQVMRIPLLKGRLFETNDSETSRPVALVNDSFVRRFGGGAAAEAVLGKSIQVYQAIPQLKDDPRLIVGVVGDVKNHGLNQPDVPTVYFPVEQVPSGIFQLVHTFLQTNWVIRTRDGGVDVAAVRAALLDLDPRQPFSGFRTMEQIMSGSIRDQKFQASLLAIFSLLALAMALGGVYSVVAFSVNQQRREIGIRMALGADFYSIVRRIVTRGLLLSGLGLVTGLLAFAVLSRTLQGFLFGVGALDLTTFTSVSLFLLLAASIASLVPALRAARINPALSLREE